MHYQTHYRCSLFMLLLPFIVGIALLVVVPAGLSFVLGFTAYDRGGYGMRTDLALDSQSGLWSAQSDG
jgi:ABC-type sugar transport system permease subunit